MSMTTTLFSLLSPPLHCASPHSTPLRSVEQRTLSRVPCVSGRSAPYALSKNSDPIPHPPPTHTPLPPSTYTTRCQRAQSYPDAIAKIHCCQLYRFIGYVSVSLWLRLAPSRSLFRICRSTAGFSFVNDVCMHSRFQRFRNVGACECFSILGRGRRCKSAVCVGGAVKFFPTKCVSV